jgi:ABC-2 type transport system permease protein
VIERCRVTPVSRAALLLGRSLRDVVTMLAQAIVITVLALPFGLRVPLGYLLVAYVLLALLALTTTALSYDITLLIRDAQTLGQVINSVSQPIGLLAGVLVPIALAPAWIQSVSWWIPFSWATKGMRALFNGNIGDPAVWQGMTIVVVLAVASVAWSTYLFRRSVR